MGRLNILRKLFPSAFFLLLVTGGSAVEVPHQKTITDNQSSMITVGLYDLPKTLNPAHVGTMTEWTFLYNLCERLIGGGLHGDLETGLAYKWTVSRTKNTISFFLKPNKFFSDGQKIRAQDVLESFRFQYTHTGSTKLRLNEVLENCGKEFGSPCEGIKIEGEDQIIFNFKKNKLVDPSIFGVADFGIFPASSLRNSVLDNRFAITSGKYFVRQWNVEKIILEPNRFYSNPAKDLVQVVEIPAGKDFAAWSSEDPKNRVVRIPLWDDSQRLDPAQALEASEPFWVRLAFISSDSTALNGPTKEKNRQSLRINLTKTLNEVLKKSIDNKLIPNFQNSVTTLAPQSSGAELSPPSSLTFVINTFSFSDVQADELQKCLKRKFPYSRVELYMTASKFLDRIKLGNFDVGLAQMSFGPTNISSVLRYMVTVYFKSALPPQIMKLISDLQGFQKPDQKLILQNKVEHFFQEQNIIFGLGQARAGFIYPSTLNVLKEQLVTGEFDFSSFQK